jgi:VIT1/CCC1 family predicted Fe2+/Mn2+ transporter
MPHYPAVRRLIVHGLERNSSQAHGAAWTRTFHFLLESIGLAFPVLASCLWKDSATAILSLVLPLLSPQHTATHSAFLFLFFIFLF